MENIIEILLPVLMLLVAAVQASVPGMAENGTVFLFSGRIGAVVRVPYSVTSRPPGAVRLMMVLDIPDFSETGKPAVMGGAR